ncbi:MAG: hypothetical protein MK135_07550 [Polyangiaceae bacterium]|nr:hypothetical protein [Polyangiaceae bacterium]
MASSFIRSGSSRVFLSVASCTLTLFASACGGPKKVNTAESIYEEDDGDDPGDGPLEMEQDCGGMNGNKVNRVVRRLQDDLGECLMSGYDAVDYFGGDVAFLVEVNRGGQAEQVFVESSNLGNYQVEQCMMDLLKDSRWPKPVGGLVGLARTNMGFDPPEDVRPPESWTSNDISSFLVENNETFQECGEGGPYTITAYVAPDGQTLSAGVAHLDGAGDETAACLIETVERLTFPSPGSWAAKVSFQVGSSPVSPPECQ